MINKIIKNTNLINGYNKINSLPISLYVHWPYCSFICPYCSFNKYKDGDHVDHVKMSKSLSRELESFSRKYYHSEYQLSRPINSIYFGGGTPSLAKVSTFVETMETMKKMFPNFNVEDIEITLEVNPDQKDLKAMLKDFKQFVGVNRVSLGIQSFIDQDLKYLGRTHTSKQAVESLKIAQELFDNVTFDLIYARHQQQTLESWRNELRDALYLTHGQGHLSLYCLTFEEGTSFYKRLNMKNSSRHKINQLDHDSSGDLYEVTLQETEKRGFKQYEVSNFASSDSQKSKHNLNYWRGGDYIGIGPGSSSRITVLNNDSAINRYSIKNILHPKDWMKELLDDNGSANINDSIVNNPKSNSLKNAFLENQLLSNSDVANELLLMGLRTTEGVHNSTFSLLTNGLDITQYLNMKKVEQLVEQDLLIFNNNNNNNNINNNNNNNNNNNSSNQSSNDNSNSNLKLTKKGIMLLDTIINSIVP